MLKASLYFVTKSTLPFQISENSEADLGSVPHLGCNRSFIVTSTRRLVLHIAGILHLPLKFTIATISMEKFIFSKVAVSFLV